MATSSGGGLREGSARATVADHICQSIQSTSNLLHLMQDSSPAQQFIRKVDPHLIPFLFRPMAHLIKLPKNLLAKASTVKNTGQVLEQLPRVISSLDAYTQSSLQSAPYLKTVTQLLSHMESSQLRSAFPAYHCGEEQKDPDAEKNVETGS